MLCLQIANKKMVGKNVVFMGQENLPEVVQAERTGG